MQVCKDIGGTFAAPLVAVQREEAGPQGQAKGTIATSPKEVDSILRKVLGEIFDGNTKDAHATADNYIQSYDKYLFKQKAAQITPLTGKDLQITANEMRESAGDLTIGRRENSKCCHL